jgi:stage II sporulation protein D
MPNMKINFLLILFFAVIFQSIRPVGLMANEQIQPEPWIRVAIVTGVSSVTVYSTGAVTVADLATSKNLESLENPHTFTFELNGKRIGISGTKVFSTGGFSITGADESVRVQVNGRTYRRGVRVSIWQGEIVCVNVLPIEEYLWGVVPCEVPDTWPTETLKAQAIAARTYSLRALEQYPERPFDVYCTTTDQVYHGSSDEAKSTTSACVDTLGEVCCWDGKPIRAYYHGSSGGWTACSAEAFGDDYPYLKAVPSRDASVYRWTLPISTQNLESALKKSGYALGKIQRVWVHRFTAEGRAGEVEIVNTAGVLFVEATELRRILGPSKIQSTYFTIDGQTFPEVPEGDNEDTQAETVSTGDPAVDESLNPSTLLDKKSKCKIQDLHLLSQDGVIDTDDIVVLGADHETCSAKGYIWMVDPLRAGDIVQREMTSSVFSLSQHSDAALRQETVVDDPGGKVGIPVNNEITFVGRGCGHGVGMSQSGAKVLAGLGWSYTRILKYFYTGIEIERYW